MKASIAHGIRPSALILGRDSHKPWSRTDIVFAKAYQRFLNELCQQCGMPKYICHNDDNRIQFRVKRDSCASTAIAEREQERISEGKSSKQHGIRVFGDPYLMGDAIEAGMELSDFRQPYLIEQAKKAGLMVDPVSPQFPETTPE